ncbi:pleckstrin homology domain-containing family M member 1 [Adelges cooleyi]|uniref:pleckstrin homology domain-containing family M member 1 n=1 Tax=Adelges cooleyi TaxID=133065 RepID=UPI00217FB80F|nr:pleckstrin homology domain-containing family M member 1 [Adelges cooleyi]
MNNLFRSIVSNKELKDETNKGSVMQHFEERLKDFQLEFVDKEEKIISSNYVADRLLASIEALFLHGLKESLISKLSTVIGDDVDRNIDVNFWHCLLILSPNGIVDQINSLKHVTTDVGKCRAWIRTTLNDGVFRSYLMSFAKYRHYIMKFYNRKAIIRDHNSFKKIIELMEGIESYNFDLTLNSSLLNTWPNGTLMLAGYWTPALKNNPLFNNNPQLAEAVDVNDTEDTLLINDNNRSEDSYTSSLSSSFVDSDFMRKPANIIDEDIGWDLIMKQPSTSYVTTSKPIKDYKSTYENAKEPVPVVTSVNKMPSTADENEEPKKEDNVLENTSDISNIIQPANIEACKDTPKLEHIQSFNDLLKSYNSRVKSYVENPEVDELYKQLTVKRIIEEQQHNDLDSLDNDDESFVKLSMHPEHLSLELLKEYLEYLFAPAHELGLNTQGFMCKGCNETIGIDFGNYYKCNFTACYYCVHCFGTEMSCIPSKILFDWDFNQYPICNRTSKFFNEIQYHPLFNVRSINRKIYKCNKEMVKSKELRWQIYYLYRFLATCKLCNTEELSKDIWPREYFYNNIHLYSFFDLQEIYSGALFDFLEQKITVSRNHVYNCQTCRQKGFICEICKDSRIIYPFDIADNYRCHLCKTVFHRKCYKETKSCPKCERNKMRLHSKDFYDDEDTEINS